MLFTLAKSHSLKGEPHFLILMSNSTVRHLNHIPLPYPLGDRLIFVCFCREEV